MDQRWVGAPFSAALRRHQSDYFDPDDKTLRIVLISLSSGSMVNQIKYLSIILQVCGITYGTSVVFVSTFFFLCLKWHHFT